MDVQVEHEPGRFFARQGGEEAELVYERRGAILDVQHTYTPPTLRGREIAAQLTAAVFAYAEQHGLKILPTCSYTRAYLTRHPELHALLAAECQQDGVRPPGRNDGCAAGHEDREHPILVAGMEA